MKSCNTDGKAISCIHFPDEFGSSINYPVEGTGNIARMVVEFHGEYDIEWVCEFDANGVEVRRWRATYLAGIEWERSNAMS